ncbi:PH domain-containing protein [Halovivax sp.]|uniref:PH domain-containing protein n=1 Tax=Halovivax sp. TaxID=1935978 RepID=UPI0025C44D8B|nr:PH domain-containing protein [Halovivax sp.]
MRRLHPASVPVRSLSRSLNLGFLFFLVGIFASPGGAGMDVVRVGLMVLVGVVVAVVYEVAYYKRFRYELTSDTFDVTSGVFARRNREVPLRRIQNVDIRQNVLQRALGLAAVHVESAGGGQTEVSLRFVAETEAQHLQRTLRRGAEGADTRATERRADTDSDADAESTERASESRSDGPRDRRGVQTDSGRDRFGDRSDGPRDLRGRTDRPRDREEPETELLFEIRSRELAILSVFTIDPGASLLATIALSFASGFDPTTLVPVDALEGGLPGTGLVVLGWILLVFLLVAWVLSAILTFNRYYGFRLTRVGDELYYERGLAQRYSGTIPLEKVQTVTVTESVPFRWFGYASLAVETAGYAPGQSGGRGQESAIPLAGRERVLALARSLEPFGAVRLRAIPKRARERYAIRYASVVGLAMAAAYAVASYTVFERWYLVAGFFLLVPVAAHLKWRSRGYSAGDGYFLARTGVWKRTTKVVPYYRVQSVVDTRTIFQRRRRLATITADTASSASFFGRAASAIDADAARASALRETLAEKLYEQLHERAERRRRPLSHASARGEADLPFDGGVAGNLGPGSTDAVPVDRVDSGSVDPSAGPRSKVPRPDAATDHGIEERSRDVDDEGSEEADPAPPNAGDPAADRDDGANDGFGSSVEGPDDDGRD